MQSGISKYFVPLSQSSPKSPSQVKKLKDKKSNPIPNPKEKLSNTLKWPKNKRSTTPARKKNKASVILYSPKDVSKYTPCELILEVLPEKLANTLLQEMLVESKTWHRNRWWLFNRQVTSSYNTSLYMTSQLEEYSRCNKYYYNGAVEPDIRKMPTMMEDVRTQIARIVNERLGNENSGELWNPNVAVANCYDSAKECVGYHSDQVYSYLLVFYF
jgi:hypothetical protein